MLKAAGRVRAGSSLAAAFALVLVAGCSGGGGGNGSTNETARRAPRDPPPGGPLNPQLILETCVPPAERATPARDLAPERRVAIRDCVHAETARQYAPHLPMRLSPRTVMEEARVEGPGLFFSYRTSERLADLRPDVGQGLETETRALACASPAFQEILVMGGMQTYRWIDRDGTLIREVRVDRC